MVEEHIGKKRRKEIRQAINLKKECNKRILRSLIVIVVIIAFIGLFTFVGVLGYFNFSSMYAQCIMFGIAIVGMFIAGNDANKFWDARKQYKDVCAKYSITKKDMAALKAMD